MARASSGGARRGRILLGLEAAGVQPGLGFGVPQNRAVCNGFLQPPGSAWGSAPAWGTRGRAGRPHVLRQPRAAEPGVASARPVALPALQAPASPLSLPVSRAAVPPGHRARWPRDAGQGGSCLPAPCSCFINNAAPGGERRVLSPQPGDTRPPRHPGKREANPAVPAPPSLSPQPQIAGPGGGCGGGPAATPRAVPAPRGSGGADGGAQLAGLPWQCAGANEAE